MEFLNNVDLVSFIFGVFFIYCLNLFFSLEQMIFEFVLYYREKRKVLKNASERE